METSVLIRIDPNPNCDPVDGLVFQPRTTPRVVSQIRQERGGVDAWCDITGLDEEGQPCPAMACMIDDSGDGAAYLIYGGDWGLRLRNGSAEWGEGYLLLPASGDDLRFE